ncbi:MAG: hypothetical protein FJZ64_02250, partial [Chlamydiae bacterium]|nr:hypothetical protein [Chlamydiota bacterium]
MRFLILIFILSPFIVLYGTSWSTATQISNVSTVFFNVYTASGPITGDLVATWARQDSSHSPYFAVYSGGVWSSAAAIPLGGSS